MKPSEMMNTFGDQNPIFRNGSLGEEIDRMLRKHGEVIIRMASSQTWEIHLGDQGQIRDTHLIFKDSKGDWHTLLYDQVERLTTHRAHGE